MINPCSRILDFLYQTFGVMKVIKAVYLGQIELIRKDSVADISLMPGHMERICAALSID